MAKKYDIWIRPSKVCAGFNAIRFTSEDAIKAFQKEGTALNIFAPHRKVAYLNEWRGITKEESDFVLNNTDGWRNSFSFKDDTLD